MKKASEISFDEIYQTYKTDIYKFCYNRVSHSEVEDIVAEVFLALYEQWNKINNKNEASIRSWLFAAAKNKIYNIYRQEKRSPTIESLELYKAIQENSDEDYNDTNFLFNEYIKSIMNILNQKERILFEYKVIKKLSLKEISKIMDKSEAAIKMQWSRLQNDLKPFIKKLIEK